MVTLNIKRNFSNDAIFGKNTVYNNDMDSLFNGIKTFETDYNTNVASINASISAIQTNLSTNYFRKNFIINGNMDVWQRGTSFATIATATYTADRFAYYKAGAAVHTVSQDTDVPTYAEAGIKLTYSLKLDCTTADTSIAATDYVGVLYKVEGYDARQFVGKQITLSFWVKGTKTGIHSVAFRSSTSNRGYAAEYTINTTNTWERKTITITMEDGTTGTWNWSNGIGLQIFWALLLGSNFDFTPGSWQSADVAGSVNQVNACDSTDNNWLITGIQLELGATATAIEWRPMQQELALCYRYYYVMGNTGHNDPIMMGYAVDNNTASFAFTLPVEMCIAHPALSVSSADDFYIQQTNNYAGSAFTADVNSTYKHIGFSFDIGTTSLTVHGGVKLVVNDTANARLIVDGEL